MTTERVALAVIGGSGLYDMAGLTERTEITLDTPFGAPSAPIVVGTLHGQRVAFLARHGVGHVFTPTTVPYKANIFALKTLGVRFVVAVNACGSLREDYAPGHLAVPDQLFDHTRHERGGRTFFDTGLVGHVSMADPLSPELGDLLFDAVGHVGGIAHRGGTFITIEGPRFSTRGESHIYRAWGCSLIGMTSCPEAFLAAEAQMAYATLAHITDYDVWHATAEPVTNDMVLATMQRNLDTVKATLSAFVEQFDPTLDLPAHHTLANAIMTAPARQDAALRATLAPLFDAVTPA